VSGSISFGFGCGSDLYRPLLVSTTRLVVTASGRGSVIPGSLATTPTEIALSPHPSHPRFLRDVKIVQRLRGNRTGTGEIPPTTPVASSALRAGMDRTIGHG